MSTPQELKEKIAEVKADVLGLKVAIADLSAELSAVIGRFLAKLAAGVDTSSEIAELNTIKADVSDLKSQVIDATNQAKIEGL